jgi:hypothetical protein
VERVRIISGGLYAIPTSTAREINKEISMKTDYSGVLFFLE